VVASATGGIQEVVVDGVTGYLVPFAADAKTGMPGDPEQFARDLAAKISAVLGDPAMQRRFGEAGRRRVEEKFGWPAIAAQTIQLYESLLR
ncbi:MAG: glycosyltransferase, partial [Terriglobales bacterium]